MTTSCEAAMNATVTASSAKLRVAALGDVASTIVGFAFAFAAASVVVVVARRTQAAKIDR